MARVSIGLSWGLLALFFPVVAYYLHGDYAYLKLEFFVCMITSAGMWPRAVPRT